MNEQQNSFGQRLERSVDKIKAIMNSSNLTSFSVFLLEQIPPFGPNHFTFVCLEWDSFCCVGLSSIISSSWSVTSSLCSSCVHSLSFKELVHTALKLTGNQICSHQQRTPQRTRPPLRTSNGTIIHFKCCLYKRPEEERLVIASVAPLIVCMSFKTPRLRRLFLIFKWVIEVAVWCQSACVPLMITHVPLWKALRWKRAGRDPWASALHWRESSSLSHTLILGVDARQSSITAQTLHHTDHLLTANKNMLEKRLLTFPWSYENVISEWSKHPVFKNIFS